MSKRQTAVEWLEQSIENTSIHWGSELYYNQKGDIFNYLVIRIQPEKLDEFFHQAKQMEKEQVQNAFDEGVDWHRDYFGKQKGMVKIRPDTYGGNHE